MSQERVEIIRAVYERFSEGDFRASAELLDPHVVLVLGPQFAPNLLASSPVAGAFYGLEAVATYTRSFLEDQTVTMEAEEIDVVGDSVVVGVRQRGVGKASGVPTELRYFTVWSFRGGKVIRIESSGSLETTRAHSRWAPGLVSHPFALRAHSKPPAPMASIAPYRRYPARQPSPRDTVATPDGGGHE